MQIENPNEMSYIVRCKMSYNSEIMNTKRAYNLLKHDEQVKEANNIWWSHLKQLGN